MATKFKYEFQYHIKGIDSICDAMLSIEGVKGVQYKSGQSSSGNFCMEFNIRSRDDFDVDGGRAFVLDLEQKLLHADPPPLVPIESIEVFVNGREFGRITGKRR